MDSQNFQDPYSQAIGMESIPPEKSGQNSDEVYAATMQEDRVKNLIEQISPDVQLMELQWRIKGYVKDPWTKEWKKVNEDAPEPHPLLVSRYISTLSTFLSQNTTLSNLSSGEINKIMRRVIEWLTDDLDSNAEFYGLKYDYTERTRIGDILLANTFFVLKRAMDGGESRRVFRALNVTENINPNYGKTSWTDALKFWK